ncbi:MAG: DM13 domain-containing protein [Pseudomonadota bacterium]
MKISTLILSAFASTALIAGAAVTPAAADHGASHAEGAEAGAKTLHSGTWTKKSFKSSGTWEIYSEGGKHYVKLSSDFRTRNAPDLKIFLSPLEASKTNGKNATDGSLLVAPLSSNSGEQVYEIPASADLASFKSVLIHCEQYSKLWSAADLV